MSAEPKTPLQAVVCVICDSLCQLPVADQVRALEAVRVTMGFEKKPVVASPQPEQTPTWEEPPTRPARDWSEAPARALPMVQVQMVNGAPVVQNGPNGQAEGGGGGEQRVRVLTRLALPPQASTTTVQARGGYVRPR